MRERLFGMRIRKIFLSIFLAVNMLVTTSIIANGEELESQEESTNLASWMSEISDFQYLSSISIPGTHDSATKHIFLGYVLRCQNTTIAEQLSDGFRYLDVRLACEDPEDMDNQNLKIIHSIGDCKMSANPFSEKVYLQDILTDVYSFLDENPSETIILNMKIEDEKSGEAQVQKSLYELIDKNPEKWFTENRIPRLGEVRGKAVLATRFEDVNGVGDDRCGLQLFWEDQGDKTVVEMPYELSMMPNGVRLWVQDRYKYSVEDKYDAVIDGLTNCEADENTIFLNFVSTAGKGPVGHPKAYAKELNKLISEYEFEKETSYGIIIMDFARPELAEKIIMTNEI